jgi:hypothetical protein
MYSFRTSGVPDIAAEVAKTHSIARNILQCARSVTVSERHPTENRSSVSKVAGYGLKTVVLFSVNSKDVYEISGSHGYGYE